MAPCYVLNVNRVVPMADFPHSRCNSRSGNRPWSLELVDWIASKSIYLCLDGFIVIEEHSHRRLLPMIMMPLKAALAQCLRYLKLLHMLWSSSVCNLTSGLLVQAHMLLVNGS